MPPLEELDFLRPANPVQSVEEPEDLQEESLESLDFLKPVPKEEQPLESLEFLRKPAPVKTSPAPTTTPSPAPAPAAAEAPDPAEAGYFSEVGKAIGRGAVNMGSFVPTAGAYIAQMLGEEEEANRLALAAAEMQNRAGEFAGEAAVKRIEDVEDVGTFLLYTASLLGEQVPLIATMIAGGTLGAGLGAAVAMGRISGALASRLAGRAAVLGLGTGGAQARVAAMTAAAVSRGTSIGARTGAFLPAAALETSFSLGELAQATGEAKLGTAAVAGAIKGGLELAAPLMFGRTIGLLPGGANKFLSEFAKRSTKSRLGKIAQGTATGALVEAGTEGTQELVDIAARIFQQPEYRNASAEIKSRVLNAIAGGAIIGGKLGALGGALQPREFREFDRQQITNRQQAGTTGGPTVAGIADPEVAAEPPDGYGLGQDTDIVTVDGKNRALTGLENQMLAAAKASVVPRIVTAGQDRGFIGDTFSTTEGEISLIPANNSTDLETQIAGQSTQELSFFDFTPLPETARSITSAVQDLPSTVQNSRVLFPKEMTPEARQEAIGFMQRAIDLRTQGQTQLAQEGRYNRELFAEAAKNYAEALARGTRVLPTEGGSIAIVAQPGQKVGDLKGATITTDLPFSQRTSAVGVRNIPFPFKKKGASFFVQPFPEGGKPASAAYGNSVLQEFVDLVSDASSEGTNRAVSIDLNRVDDKKVSAIPEDIAAIARRIAVGRDPEIRSSNDEILEAITDETGIQARWQPNVTLEATKTTMLDKLRRLGEATSYAYGKPELTPSQFHDLLFILEKGIKFDVSADTAQFVVFEGGATLEALTPGVDQPIGRLSRLPTNVIGASFEDGRQERSGPAEVRLAHEVKGTIETLTGESPKFKKELKKFMDGIPLKITPILQRLGVKGKLEIHLLSSQTEFDTTRGEFFVHDDVGHINIYYNHSNIRNLDVDRRIDTMKMTLIHEVGHYVHAALWSATPIHTKLLLFQAYKRDILATRLRDINFSFRSRMHGPPTFEPGTSGRVDLARDIQNPAQASANYLLGFVEWMAQQHSAYISGEPQLLAGPVQEFFERTIRRILDTIKALKEAYGIESFTASKEYRDWVESFSTHKVSSSSTSEAMMRDLTESKVKNMEAMDETAGNAPPETVMGHATQKMIDHVYNGNPPPRARLIRGVVDKINWFTSNTLTLDQMAWKNPDNPFLQKYVQLTELFRIRKMEVINRADVRMAQLRRLLKGEHDKLSEMLFWADQMEYLTPDERAQRVLRHPTEEEITAKATELNLDEATLEAYFDVQTDFEFMLDHFERVWIQNIVRTVANEDVAAAQIADVVSKVRQLKAKPYFPHTRFGQWTITFRAPPEENQERGRIVHFETVEGIGSAPFQEQTGERIARKRARELQRSDPELAGLEPQFGRLPEEVEQFLGLPPFVLRKIRQDMPGLTLEQKDWIQRLEYELAPHESFRKKWFQRQNIPGWSFDAQRVYAHYFLHASNHLARLEYGEPMTETIEQMESASRDLESTVKRSMMADFMRKHRDWVLNPGKDWAQIRAFAFLWHIGGNVASAVLNLTQIPLVTLPYLSARYSDGKAMNELRKGYRDWLDARREDPKRLTDFEYAIIDIGTKEGWLEESQATDIAANAEGRNLLRGTGRSTLQRGFTDVLNMSTFFFQEAEKVNRHVTALAAARLSMQNRDASYLRELRQARLPEMRQLITEHGWSDEQALTFLAAKDAVKRTQYNYAKEFRPRFMRGRVGSLFVFFNFVQQSVFFATQSRGKTGAGMGRYWLMMALAGGLMGLPGAEDLKELVKYFWRKAGYGPDPEIALREFLVPMLEGTIFDEIGPDLLLHGTSRFGFGLPHVADTILGAGPHFDMSAAVGLGRIVPGFTEGMRAANQNKSFFEVIGEGVSAGAGAGFGIPLAMMRSLSDIYMAPDDPKRWESAIPKAIRNFVKAHRWYTEEKERTRQGGTLVNFDPNDPKAFADIAAQALGFTPLRISQKWDRVRAQTDMINYWAARRETLIRQLDQAVLRRDAEARSDVLKAIRNFNRDLPKAVKVQAIRGETLQKALRTRAGRRALTNIDLPPNRRDAPTGIHINKLYPQIIDDTPVR